MVEIEKIFDIKVTTVKFNKKLYQKNIEDLKQTDFKTEYGE